MQSRFLHALLGTAAVLLATSPAFSQDFVPLTRAEPVVRMVLQEANGEPLLGMIVVAAVALDRVADPRWPSNVGGVVYQPWQFTGMRYRLGEYTEGEVETARRAVRAARMNHRPCGPGVFWFHTLDTEHPELWPPMQKRCTIGNHVFFGDAYPQEESQDD